MSGFFYSSRPGYGMEKLFLLIEFCLYCFTFYVFPNYQNFTRRGDCLVFLMYRVFKLCYHLVFVCSILSNPSSVDAKLLLMVLSNVFNTILPLASIIVFVNKCIETHPHDTHETVKTVFEGINSRLSLRLPSAMRPRPSVSNYETDKTGKTKTV